MNLNPFLEVTFVSQHAKVQVLGIITANTHLVDAELISNESVFNGSVDADGFRISERIRTPQNGLPLVLGKVEDTSLGSLIFLKLKLFPAAKLYLQFSSLLCLLVAVIFLLAAKNVNVAIVALAVGFLNYVLLSLNFHRKAKVTVEKIKGILE